MVNTASSMGLRAWCRANGVAPSTLAKALDTGKVARLPDGTLDVVSAAEWLATRGTTPPRQPQGRSGGPRRGSVAASQRKLIEYRARLARLEYLKRKGEVVDAREVCGWATATARRTKDQLFAMIPRVSAAVLGLPDLASVTAVMEGEVRRICEENATGLGAADAARPGDPA